MSVRWSHSKLSCLLNCPMTYYLNYVVGMKPIVEKQAFAIGSAVHWGLEHNTEDLTEYYGKDAMNYSQEQALAEAMAHGYLVHKEEIFNEILDDGQGGKLKLLDEEHEVMIIGKLQSTCNPERFHEFIGIIDLLLLVEDKAGNKSFIIIDYKTSSMIPNWSDYLEQIYRYIFLLRSEFPNTPVKKIGIVNIRKIKERQRSSENMIQYANRLRLEYEINDMSNINTHMYDVNALDQVLVNSYIDNLSKQVDLAAEIDEHHLFYINYGALVGKYGKSDYYDVFMKTKGAHVFYKISDYVWSEDEGKFVNERLCVDTDMMVIDFNNVIFKYEQFKELLGDYMEADFNEEEFIEDLQKHWIISDKLLETYMLTAKHDESIKCF